MSAGFQLGLVTRRGRVSFLIAAPDRCLRIIAMQLSNAYPGGQIEAIQPSKLPRRHTRWLRLSPDVLSLRGYDSFQEVAASKLMDPLESLLEVIKTGDSDRIQTELWFDIQPAREQEEKYLRRQATLLLSNLKMKLLRRLLQFHGSRPSSKSRWLTWLLTRICRLSRDLRPFEQKLSLAEFSTSLRIDFRSHADSPSYFDRKSSEIAAALSLLTAPDSAFFVEKKKKYSSFQLTANELATLWHLPTVNVHVPRIHRQAFKELEPPSSLTRSREQANLVLGQTAFRDQRFQFGMDLESRRRHLWILGKTGMGKTTLLQHVIHQDLHQRRGFAVLEPHGDLAHSTLRNVPSYRKNDLLYFDPADSSNRITFNPLFTPSGGDKTLVADGVLTAFQKVFGFDESQAPRLIHIFRNCLLSLVEMPHPTLLDVQRLLLEPLYRKSVIARVANPAVRTFWLDEFGKWKPGDRTAFIASLQNKLGAFLTNDKLQRVLSDPRAKLDLRDVMDSGKVLIVNLSKGRLGENASDLLGTLLVTSLQQAAMTRANLPEADRRDFSIIIDEFQNFATPSIATFLSEARKYRTHLIVANQFAKQIPEEIRDALFGNVGSQIAFQLSASDAELMAREFGDESLQPHFANLPRFHAYCRLAIDQVTSQPFSMSTIPPRPNSSKRHKRK